MKWIRIGWMLCVGMAESLGYASAQAFEVRNVTELQANGRGEANLINLLRLEGTWGLKNGSLDIASIHIFRSKQGHIAGDWQMFSNIEEKTLPGSLAILGYTQRFRRMSLFFGVRNVNEDYFDSPATSLFTNSSCGIFPTLSANYPLANYPLSAVCIDYKCSLGRWNLQTSLYNGAARSSFGGKESIFRVNPKEEGVFSISSINYQTEYGCYYGGLGLHNRVYALNEEGEWILEPQATEEPPAKKMNAAWWAYVEQLLAKPGGLDVNVLLQYSENYGSANGCKRYAGIGIVLSDTKGRHLNSELGIFTNYACFAQGTEVATELTWRKQLNNNMVVQTALHCITNTTGTYTIGMVRLIVAVGSSM